MQSSSSPSPPHYETSKPSSTTRASTSAAATVAAPPACPFVRVRISSSLIPPPLTNVPLTPCDETRAALSPPLISLERWADLWSTVLQPIGCRVAAQKLWLVRVPVILLIVVVVTSFVVLVVTALMAKRHRQDELTIRVAGTLVNYAVLVGSVVGYAKWRGCVQQSHLNQLQAALQSYEDLTCFQQELNVTVECQCSVKDGLHLLLIPRMTNNDETNTSQPAKASDTVKIALSAHYRYFGWASPISLSHMKPYKVPPSLRSIFVNCAGRATNNGDTSVGLKKFWSNVATASLRSRRAHALNAMLPWFLLLYLTQLVWLSSFVPILLVLVASPIWQGLQRHATWRSQQQLDVIQHGYQELLQAPKSCQNAWILYCNDVQECNGAWFGLYDVRYLVLTPRPPSPSPSQHY